MWMLDIPLFWLLMDRTEGKIICWRRSNLAKSELRFFDRKLYCRVFTSPGNPGKSWNFTVAFSGLESPGKCQYTVMSWAMKGLCFRTSVFTLNKSGFLLLSADSQQVKDLRETYNTATEYLQNCKLIPQGICWSDQLSLLQSNSFRQSSH